jgi:hypothetical protein
MFRQLDSKTQTDLTIRRLDDEDAEALERVAQRDSAPTPGGTVYAAVAPDGTVLAAISLDTGALVADPFLPTEDAARLLRVWADQFTNGSRPHRSRRALTPAPARTAVPC